MKLAKFRIRNYRSIRDSGDCYLASDVTVLAGKNESGKTAILEALRDFNLDASESTEASRPLKGSGLPSVEFHFTVTSEDLDQIGQKARLQIPKDLKERIARSGITVIKHFGDGSYSLDPSSTRLIDQQREDANKKHLDRIRAILTKIEVAAQLSGIPKPDLSKDVARVQSSVRQFAAAVTAKLSGQGQIRSSLSKLLHSLNGETEALERRGLSEDFRKSFLQALPKMILFSDFLDVLPFEIPFDQVFRSQPVKDFAKVAQLDLGEVAHTKDSQRRRNLLSQHSATISGDFLTYWEQNQLELIAEADGENLRLGIKETNDTLLYKTEQRSKGLQWFLSFYLRLKAQQGSSTNTILIDEPGLYLHAKAQEDVLKVLQRISETEQVIFSTHSPYLIDPARLDRIRLVLKDGSGTRIENKVHKGADQETLTPIMTAIGLSISQGLNIVADNNVLVEGISDHYLLRALSNYMTSQRLKQLRFIPCVGAQKILTLASLLIGWDLKFAALLDTDQEGRRVARDLEEKFRVDSTRIVPVADGDDVSLEDLLTREDFGGFFLREPEDIPDEVSNSRYLRDRRHDKVLLAKLFFEKTSQRHRPRLSTDTIVAFQRIFVRIADGLGIQ